MFIHDKSPNRDQLKQFDKTNLAVRGVIQNVTMPEPNRRNICLINVHVAPVDNNQLFLERDGLIYDHLWIADTRPRGAGYSAAIGDPIQMHAKVRKYKRDATHKSRTLDLLPGIITESAFTQRMMMMLQQIRQQFIALDERVSKIHSIIDEHIYQMQNNMVLCFDLTKDQWLDELRKEKGVWMRQGGVYTTLNRQGRRASKQPVRKTKNYHALGFV